MKFYETVYRLDDNLLNKVGINLNYKTMKFRSSKRLFQIHLGLITISCIIDYIYASNKSYIFILIIYNYTAGAGLISSLEYINCAKIIKFRLKSLNDLLTTYQHINSKNLQIIIECHFTLNGLIINMNEIYGLRQLSGITNDFVIITVQLYSFFVSIDNDFNNFFYVKFLFGLLMLPQLIAKLYFTSTNCEEVIFLKRLWKIIKKV